VGPAVVVGVEAGAVEVWAFDVCVVVVVVWVAGGDFGMGRDMPRSFPRLATPTPHVNVVRYPVQSFPSSIHCPQYGLRRSHLTCRFVQAKQSALAPVAGALLLRFLGAAEALLVVVRSGFWVSVAGAAGDVMAAMGK
jgi:hypothetical protein